MICGSHFLIRHALFLIPLFFLASLFIAVSAQAQFLGPCGPPGGSSSCALLIASTTRAIQIATSTIFSAEPVLKFQTGGGSNQHIIFLPNGFVGIGTATPQAPLHVTGSVNAPMYYDSENTNYYIDPAANTGRSAIFAGSVGVGTTTPAALFTVATTTNIFNVLSNGNVGIGTTAPGAPLAFANSVGNKIFLYGGGSNDSYGFAIQTSELRTFAGNTATNKITFGYLTSGTGAFNEWMRIQNGNVGIGTTGPGAKLHVVQTSGTGLIVDAPSNNSHLAFETSGSRKWVQYLVGNDLRFWDSIGSADRVTFQQGGNVGIGTTNPLWRLTVSDVTTTTIARFTGSSGGTIYIDVSNSAANSPMGIRFVDNTGVTRGRVVSIGGTDGLVLAASSWATHVYINNLGNVGIGTTTPSNPLTVAGNANITGVLTVGSCVGCGGGGGGVATTSPFSAGYIPLATSSSAITNSVIFQSGANIGIGTTTPQAPLHVTGSVNAPMYYDSENTNYYIDPAANTGRSAIFAGSVGVGTTTPAALFTVATTTNIFNVLSNGNVGIGTTGPGAKLHVVQTSGTGLIVDAPSNNSHLAFETSGSRKWVQYLVGNDLRFWDSIGSADRVTFQQGGNVGIGTTGPSGKLHVNTGTTTDSVALRLDPSSGSGATFSTYRTINNEDALRLRVFRGGTNPIRFEVDNYGNVLLQPEGGNVAIGTTTIQGKVHIAGGTLNIAPNIGTGINLGNNDIIAVRKLSVTTIDPLYEIGGVKYATYVSDTIGLKMEMYGKAYLTKSFNDNNYSSVLDFKKAKEGSDLWLFWQTIQEGKDMEDVIVNLTPEFNGRVWYELRPAEKQIVIYGEPPDSGFNSPNSLNVSYHLAAPRHDADRWPTVTQTAEPAVVLKIKN